MDILGIVPRGSCKPMTMALDKRYLTPQQDGAHYVELDGRRVRGLYDTGSNCTIVSKKLARELGMQTLPYNGNFR